MLPDPLFRSSCTSMGLENQVPSLGLSDGLTCGVPAHRKVFAVQASSLPHNSLDHLIRFCLSSHATGAILV